MPRDSSGLTPKQKRFVDEYLIDVNATQAAIRAGYSEKTAHVQGPRLLQNAGVSRAIESRRAELSEKTGITQEYILNGLNEVARRCLEPKRKMKFDFSTRSMLPVTDADGNQIFEFDAQGANRALELLGKHQGMFSDKMSLTIENPLKDATDDRLNELEQDLITHVRSAQSVPSQN